MIPQALKERLQTAYPDASIQVIDLTGTEDHYHVEIATRAFKGLSRINQHKAVMSVFDSELKTGEIHALTIKTTILE